jgi:ethanolamine ammonia-lyase small subunit
MNAIYTHARRALYASLDNAVISDVSPRRLCVRTRALDREDYLAHPRSGEAIREEDACRISALYPSRRPRVQVVISDGLNANAINENLRGVLPPLRSQLVQAGHHIGDIDIVIENGRVRAGYHVGALLDAEVIIHLIGERPGTGLNTMSAYLSYGRDTTGVSRWSSDFDHSWTTAICGIHSQGKPPATAVDEITRSVGRIFERRCSGVALGSESPPAR